MDARGVQLVHAVPGRVRFKVPEVKRAPRRAAELERRLAAVRGIRRVEANPVTGSLLVFYAPAHVESFEFQVAVADALGISVTDLESTHIDFVLQGNGHGTWTAADASSLGTGIQDTFGMVNREMTRMTGGIGDLRALVPVALLALGVRSLLIADKLPFPTWYDYFWFAFGSFFLLNRGAEAPR